MFSSELFSFQGRASRSKFWLVFLLSIFVSFVVVLFTLLATPALMIMGTFSPTVASIVSMLLYVLMIPMWWISIATSVKRFHDRNKSGWWYLIILIPFIGALWIIIENGFLKGTTGANNFGSDSVLGNVASNFAPGAIATSPSNPAPQGMATWKLITLIVGGIILVAVIGRVIWAYQAMKSDFTSVNIDIGGGAENPAKFSINGIDAQTITGTPFSVPSNVIVNPVTNQVKSEIDKYGVDLYTLKQGVTTVVKNIDGIIRTVVYTRSMNSIEREVTFSRPDGSSSISNTTIDLDAKDKLPSAIKEMESQFAADCTGTSTSECQSSKMVIDYIKKNCVALQKNEEISVCMVAGVMSAWANQAQ